MGGPREIGALSNFPAYRTVLLYFYLVTHVDVLGKGKKLVER
jgi:hypothetical protein